MSGWLLIVSIVMAAKTSVWAQDLDTGRIEFMSKCAECHGADGKGAGLTSNKLKSTPADLTILAKRNSGVFYRDAVYKRIDGRSAISPHRSSGMPIWGYRHGPPDPQSKDYDPGSMESLLDIACDLYPVIRSHILAVVEYPGRIQEKLFLSRRR
jgi:hypothetical protein